MTSAARNSEIANDSTQQAMNPKGTFHMTSARHTEEELISIQRIAIRRSRSLSSLLSATVFAVLSCAMATHAEADTIFAADFQGTAVDQGAGTVTEGNLLLGTQTGSWDVFDDAISLLDSDGTNRGFLIERDGVDITAEFASSGSLAAGVTISYEATLRRAINETIGRAALMKGLASDGTVLFVLGIQGGGSDPGSEQLVRYSADFDGDGDSGNNPTRIGVGSTGTFVQEVGSNYDEDLMVPIELQLSATTFDILINGSLATNGDDVPYLNSASDITRLNFQADFNGGAWYDNFDVQATFVPEPSTAVLLGIGLLGLGLRRRQRR